MGHNEPYWQTNTSFSPPLSRTWDHRFQSEGPLYGSRSGVQLYGSSLSSNSKESRSWVRGNHFPNHQHSTSDGVGSYFSSPSDSFLTQQLIPRPMQGVNIDNYTSTTMREPASGPLAFTPSMEGTSAIPYSAGSTSSPSDGNEYESMVKTHISSHSNFSGHCSFMSKPIHPILFPSQTLEREAPETTATGNSFNLPKPYKGRNTSHLDSKSIRSVEELHSVSGFSEVGATTPQREMLRWSSSSSSIDFTDVSEQLDSESVGPSYKPSDDFKCGLCERLLLQSSPWSSRRIVRSGDMPVTGVLSCCHVFHAECLEQTTPKTQKHDPPCPLCVRSEEHAPEQPMVSQVRNVPQKLRPFGEDGPSRPWDCGQVGDCVEGALHAPPRNSMVLLNRSRLKKHLSLKGNSSKGIPDKLKKSESISLQLLNGRSVDQGLIGCSRTTAGPSLKRW